MFFSTHRRWQAWLPAYLAGELSPRAHAQCAAHLRGCAACRDECAALEALAVDLRRADPATPVAPARTERLLPRLHAELAALPVARPRRTAWSALAAVLLFGGGLLTGGRLFPRVVTNERVVTRTVEVPVTVTKTVVERVAVPVSVPRVVTRVVTKVVYRDRPTAAAPRAAVDLDPVPPAPRPQMVNLPSATQPQVPVPVFRPVKVRF